MTRPRVARRSSRFSSVPEIPATASDVTKASRMAGSAAARAQDGGEGARGQAIEARQPGAVGDPHTGQRDSGSRELGSDDARPGRGRATRGDRRAELLQQQLRGEVVALAVHELEEDGEPLREVERDRERLLGRATGACPAGDGDPAPGERIRERARGGDRRAVDPRQRQACDRERRERRATRCPRSAASSRARRGGRRSACRRRGCVPRPVVLPSWQTGEPSARRRPWSGSGRRSRRARDCRSRCRRCAFRCRAPRCGSGSAGRGAGALRTTTGSFSAEAGRSERRAFEEYTVRPVRRSTAIAAVSRGLMPGARRARSSAPARPGEAASGDAVPAVAASATAIRATTARRRFTNEVCTGARRRTARSRDALHPTTPGSLCT